MKRLILCGAALLFGVGVLPCSASRISLRVDAESRFQAGRASIQLTITNKGDEPSRANGSPPPPRAASKPTNHGGFNATWAPCLRRPAFIPSAFASTMRMDAVILSA